MLTAIILTIVLAHIFRFIVRYFLSFVLDLLNQPYSKFHAIDHFLIFQERFQLPFFDTG